MADEAQSIAELSRAVANLTQSLALALAENQQLKQQLGSIQRSVDQFDRMASQPQRPNQSMAT